MQKSPRDNGHGTGIALRNWRPEPPNLCNNLTGHPGLTSFDPQPVVGLSWSHVVLFVVLCRVFLESFWHRSYGLLLMPMRSSFRVRNTATCFRALLAGRPHRSSCNLDFDIFDTAGFTSPLAGDSESCQSCWKCWRCWCQGLDSLVLRIVDPRSKDWGLWQADESGTDLFVSQAACCLMDL